MEKIKKGTGSPVQINFNIPPQAFKLAAIPVFLAFGVGMVVGYASKKP